MFPKINPLSDIAKSLQLKDQWRSKGGNWEGNFWLVKIPKQIRWKGEPKNPQKYGYFTSWAARDLVLGNSLMEPSSIVTYAIPKEESAGELERIVQQCQEQFENLFGSHLNTVPVINYIGHSQSCK
jgi:hypothetical protein